MPVLFCHTQHTHKAPSSSSSRLSHERASQGSPGPTMLTVVLWLPNSLQGAPRVCRLTRYRALATPTSLLADKPGEAQVPKWARLLLSLERDSLFLCYITTSFEPTFPPVPTSPESSPVLFKVRFPHLCLLLSCELPGGDTGLWPAKRYFTGSKALLMLAE